MDPDEALAVKPYPPVGHVLAAFLFLIVITWPSTGAAQSCSASMETLNFGSIDVIQNTTFTTTATLSVSCTGIAGRTVIVCVGFGGGSGGISGSGVPRYMASGANTLAYEIFKDAAHTNVWGSAWVGSGGTINQLNIVLNGGGTGSGILTAYGYVYTGQQSVPPGAYSSLFDASHVSYQYGYSTAGTCAGGFPYYSPPTFNVNASIVASCTVNATNLDFGSAGLLLSNIDSTAKIDTSCTSGTPYQVGLNQGLASGATVLSRRMTGGSYSIAYSLFQDAGRTTNWGNTAGMDTVGGIGTGSSQILTVYGRMPPQTTPPPGTYSDTIVVTVTY